MFDEQPSNKSTSSKNNSSSYDEQSNNKEKFSTKLKRWFWNFLGTLFLSLGIIGIFVPLLPTTPFLLLALACYCKGSKKLYNWLLNHRIFGDYIRNYYEGKGIPLKVKIVAISLLWLTIIFSIVFIVSILIVQVILLIIAIGVSWHLISLKTLRKDK